MDKEYMADNEIDTENVIQTDNNGCLVTVYFAKERNDRKVALILESLLDTFEKRVQPEMNPEMNPMIL